LALSIGFDGGIDGGNLKLGDNPVPPSIYSRDALSHSSASLRWATNLAETFFHRPMAAQLSDFVPGKIFNRFPKQKRINSLSGLTLSPPAKPLYANTPSKSADITNGITF
jgi:hypothetical protein